MKILLALLLVVTLSVSLIACEDNSSNGISNSSISHSTEYSKTETSKTEISKTESSNAESSKTEDATSKENAESSKIETSKDENNEIPSESNLILKDFLLKDVRYVKNALGNGYQLDYFTGSDMLNYKKEKVAFLFEGISASSMDDCTINYIFSYGDARLIDNLDGTMTYPEILSAVGKEFAPNEPKYFYNQMDDVWQYSLVLYYKGLVITYSWENDPNTNPSDYAIADYEVSADVEFPYPDVSEPKEESSKEENIAITNYVGTWEPISSTSSHCVIIDEQTGNTLKLSIYAVRGAAVQVASCENVVITLVDGKASFQYTDSFSNTGICHFSILDDILTLSYDTNQTSDWSLHYSKGSYKKVS
ncbi:MAG: hypothetical protein J6Q89_00855 [Clostridia bacterium]|nr:hypothetical protein [Clostridia bacterium]